MIRNPRTPQSFSKDKDVDDEDESESLSSGVRDLSVSVLDDEERFRRDLMGKNNDDDDERMQRQTIKADKFRCVETLEEQDEREKVVDQIANDIYKSQSRKDRKGETSFLISEYKEFEDEFRKSYEGLPSDKIAFEFVEGYLWSKGCRESNEKGCIHGVPFLLYYDRWIRDRIGCSHGIINANEITNAQCLTIHKSLYAVLLGSKPGSALHTVAKLSYNFRKTTSADMLPASSDGTSDFDVIISQEDIKPLPDHNNKKVTGFDINGDACAYTDFKDVSEKFRAATEYIWPDLTVEEKIVGLSFLANSTLGENSPIRRYVGDDIDDAKAARIWQNVFIKKIFPQISIFTKALEYHRESKKGNMREQKRNDYFRYSQVLPLLFNGCPNMEGGTAYEIFWNCCKKDNDAKVRGFLSDLNRDIQKGGKNRKKIDIRTEENP